MAWAILVRLSDGAVLRSQDFGDGVSETVTTTEVVPVLDEQGDPVLDEQGDPVTQTVTTTDVVTRPHPTLPEGKGLAWVPVDGDPPTPETWETVALPTSVETDPLPESVSWSTADRPLATVKAERAAEINAARDAKLAAGCLYPFPDQNGTITFRDPGEMIRYGELRLMAQAMVDGGNGSAEFPAPFRDQENVDHTITAQQLLDAMTAGRDWFMSTWVYASGLKNAVAACETLAAVAAVNVASGWPDRDLT